MENIARSFELLGMAVVQQAAEDYRKALVDQHWAYESGKEDEMRLCDSKVAELERFFTGDGCATYTRVNGNVLMERLKAEIKAYKYNLKALKKDLRKKRSGAP